MASTPPSIKGKLTQSVCSWRSTPDTERSFNVNLGLHETGSGGVSSAKKFFATEKPDQCGQSGAQCYEVSNLGDQAYQ